MFADQAEIFIEQTLFQQPVVAIFSRQLRHLRVLLAIQAEAVVAIAEDVAVEVKGIGSVCFSVEGTAVEPAGLGAGQRLIEKRHLPWMRFKRTGDIRWFTLTVLVPTGVDVAAFFLELLELFGTGHAILVDGESAFGSLGRTAEFGGGAHRVVTDAQLAGMAAVDFVGTPVGKDVDAHVRQGIDQIGAGFGCGFVVPVIPLGPAESDLAVVPHGRRAPRTAGTGKQVDGAGHQGNNENRFHTQRIERR